MSHRRDRALPYLAFAVLLGLLDTCLQTTYDSTATVMVFEDSDADERRAAGERPTPNARIIAEHNTHGLFACRALP